MSNAVVAVTDAFEIKAGRPDSDHAPGLVVVFDGRQCAFRLPSVGSRVMLLRPDGSCASASLAETKDHGDGRSFFFAGLHKADAPVGSILEWAAAEVRDDGQPTTGAYAAAAAS